MLLWSFGNKKQTKTTLSRARTSTRLNSLHFVSHWWAGSATLNQNRIGLFFSPNQLIHLVLSSQKVVDELYHARHSFWCYLSMVKNHEKKFSDPNSDLHQNGINSYLQHSQPVHKVSSKSVCNLLRYCAMYRFWPYLSMMKNHLRNSSIQIQIFNKILNNSSSSHTQPFHQI